MWRVMSMKIGTTACRVEIAVERAAPPHAVGDDHQHGDDAFEIDVAGNVAALGRGAQQVHQPLAHVGIEGGARSARSRDCAAPPAITSVHSSTCSSGRSREMMVRHAFEHGEQAAREVGARELLRRPRRGRARRCRRSAPPWRGNSGRDCPGSCRPRRRCPASRRRESRTRTKQRCAAARISARRSD